MPAVPKEGSTIILAFNSLFSKKVFEHVKVLLLGAMLTIGRHTICAALRFAGLSKGKYFHKYHRVLEYCQLVSSESLRDIAALTDAMLYHYATAAGLWNR